MFYAVCTQRSMCVSYTNFECMYTLLVVLDENVTNLQQPTSTKYESLILMSVSK